MRLGLPHSEAGVDGGKRVKGIKRQLAVDKNGFPLGVEITRANVHDSKGADRLISSVLSLFPGIEVIKADLGYRGAFREMPPFIPVKGRDGPSFRRGLKPDRKRPPKAKQVTLVRLRPVLFAKLHRSRCPHRSVFSLRKSLDRSRPCDCHFFETGSKSNLSINSENARRMLLRAFNGFIAIVFKR